MSLLTNLPLLSLTLGHFGVDMFGGMLPLILLALTDPLGLSYTQVGLVSMVHILAASLSQPFFGYLSDRFGGKRLAVLGVGGIGLIMGIIGLATRYEMLLAVAPFSGLCSAAFHPQGAANASRASGDRKGSGMSVFLLGGNTGFSIGPLLGGAVFASLGVRKAWLLSPIGLILAGLVYLAPTVPNQAQPAESSRDRANPGRWSTRAAIAGITALMVVIFLRSWLHQSVTIYLPQLYKSRGGSVPLASNMLFSVLFPLALGTVTGGFLSDRIGRRRVVAASLALLTPLFLLLLSTTGGGAFLIAPLVGICIGASFPVTLVMAQELMPRGLGVMSGLALGFTFVAGAIGVAGTGVMADHWGLELALRIVAFAPLVGAMFTLMLPSTRPSI